MAIILLRDGSSLWVHSWPAKLMTISSDVSMLYVATCNYGSKIEDNPEEGEHDDEEEDEEEQERAVS